MVDHYRQADSIDEGPAVFSEPEVNVMQVLERDQGGEEREDPWEANHVEINY